MAKLKYTIQKISSRIITIYLVLITIPIYFLGNDVKKLIAYCLVSIQDQCSVVLNEIQMPKPQGNSILLLKID